MTTEELLSTRQAAARLGVSPSYLYGLQQRGSGPAYVQRDNRIFYRPDALDPWLVARKAKAEQQRAAKEAEQAAIAERKRAREAARIKRLREQERAKAARAKRLEGLLTAPAAAERAGISIGYLYVLSHNKRGPKSTKIDARLYYKPADVDAWNAARLARCKGTELQQTA
jgi:predicted DNA-binding transcriptional regulator AlpA